MIYAGINAQNLYIYRHKCWCDAWGRTTDGRNVKIELEFWNRFCKMLNWTSGTDVSRKALCCIFLGHPALLSFRWPQNLTQEFWFSLIRHQCVGCHHRSPRWLWFYFGLNIQKYQNHKKSETDSNFDIPCLQSNSLSHCPCAGLTNGRQRFLASWLFGYFTQITWTT